MTSDLHLFEHPPATPHLPGEGGPALPAVAHAAGSTGVNGMAALSRRRLPAAAPPVPDGDSGRARMSDPITSHLAAALPGKAKSRERVLVALTQAGELGLTDFELAAHLHAQQTSVGVRRKELVDRGLATATPDLRPAPSGAQARVWQITDAGRAEAADVLRSYTARRDAAGTNERSGSEVPAGR